MRTIFFIIICLSLIGCVREADCSSPESIDDVAGNLAQCLHSQSTAEQATDLLDQWPFPADAVSANLLPNSSTEELIISYRTNPQLYDPRGKLAVLEYGNSSWRVAYESPTPKEKNSDNSHISLAGNWAFDVEEVGDVQGDGGEDLLFNLRWSNLTSITVAYPKLLTASDGIIEVITIEDPPYPSASYTMKDGHVRSITHVNGEDAITRTFTWGESGFAVGDEIVNPSAARKSVTTVDGTHYFTFDGECGSGCWHQYGLFRLSDEGESYAFGNEHYIGTLKILRDGNVYVGNRELLVVNGDRLVPLDFAPLPDDSTLANVGDMAMTCNGEMWVATVPTLVHLGHERSTVYDFYGNTITIADDDSVWVDGWDGRADSNCCIYHIKNDIVTAYKKDEITIPLAAIEN